MEDATDLLFAGKELVYYQAPRIDTKNTHGTGCTLSSAICAQLALGESLPEAVKKAKEYITKAIEEALPLGAGHGPTHHFWAFYPNH